MLAKEIIFQNDAMVDGPGGSFWGRFKEQTESYGNYQASCQTSRSEGPKEPSKERDSPITRPRCAHSANYCTTMHGGSCAEDKRICIGRFCRDSQNELQSHVDNGGKRFFSINSSPRKLLLRSSVTKEKLSNKTEERTGKSCARYHPAGFFTLNGRFKTTNDTNQFYISDFVNCL